MMSGLKTCVPILNFHLMLSKWLHWIRRLLYFFTLNSFGYFWVKCNHVILDSGFQGYFVFLK